MDNNHRLALNPEVIGQPPQRRTTAVHIGLGLGQQDIPAFNSPTTEKYIELVPLHRYLVSGCQLVNDHKTGIVPVPGVGWARIAKSGNKVQWVIRHIMQQSLAVMSIIVLLGGFGFRFDSPTFFTLFSGFCLCADDG